MKQLFENVNSQSFSLAHPLNSFLINTMRESLQGKHQPQILGRSRSQMQRCSAPNKYFLSLRPLQMPKIFNASKRLRVSQTTGPDQSLTSESFGAFYSNISQDIKISYPRILRCPLEVSYLTRKFRLQTQPKNLNIHCPINLIHDTKNEFS